MLALNSPWTRTAISKPPQSSLRPKDITPYPLPILSKETPITMKNFSRCSILIIRRFSYWNKRKRKNNMWLSVLNRRLKKSMKSCKNRSKYVKNNKWSQISSWRIRLISRIIRHLNGWISIVSIERWSQNWNFSWFMP